LLLALAAAAGQSGQQPDSPPTQLNDKTLAKWRDFIRPSADELCFETAEWLPTFWEGVIAGQQQDKPILLWAMNGHPLACT
jgi:hypothetical protein